MDTKPGCQIECIPACVAYSLHYTHYNRGLQFHLQRAGVDAGFHSSQIGGTLDS